jgi:hypothetical protein
MTDAFGKHILKTELHIYSTLESLCEFLILDLGLVLNPKVICNKDNA